MLRETEPHRQYLGLAEVGAHVGGWRLYTEVVIRVIVHDHLVARRFADHLTNVFVDYTGLGPLNISKSQEGKVKVEGDPAFAAPVHIIAADKSNLNDSKVKIWSDSTVNALGGSFVISAMFGGLTESKLKADTYVLVFDPSADPLVDDPLQLVKFHTSCSKELFLGDEFGSVQLVSFVDENGQGP